MELPRLDPLANAGPYQRLMKNPAKSFGLSLEQYERAEQTHPELIIRDGDVVTMGYLHKDQLQVHYSFPSREVFADNFKDFFDVLIDQANKDDAPRGLVLAFRDRPNRNAAEPVFWSLALDQGREWVEMNLSPVPEQDLRPDALEGGYTVREATDADGMDIAAVEAEVSGQPQLSEAGIASLYDNARWLRVVTVSSGEVVGYVALNSLPGGWGVIEEFAIKPSALDALREPLLDWTIAFLRNNGGRRIRRQVYVGDIPTFNVLRARNFAAGESGIDYTRVVDPGEVDAQWTERKNRSSMIHMGNWR